MTVDQPDTTPEDAAAPVVAAARTAGGAVLVVLGVAMVLAGGFWFFLVPWFGWATEGFWFAMADWADLGGAALGILGFVVLVLGAALIQRARKRRFEVLVDPSAVVQGDSTSER